MMKIELRRRLPEEIGSSSAAHAAVGERFGHTKGVYLFLFVEPEHNGRSNGGHGSAAGAWMEPYEARQLAAVLICEAERIERERRGGQG